MIDLATEALAELMSSDLSKRTEIFKDLSFLQSAKIQNNEADIEKIKNLLMKILWDVKENMTTEQPVDPITTADAVQGIRDALPDKPQSEINVDDMSAAVTAYVVTVLPMDDDASAMFQKLTKRLLEHPLAKNNQSFLIFVYFFEQFMPNKTR